MGSGETGKISVDRETRKKRKVKVKKSVVVLMKTCEAPYPSVPAHKDGTQVTINEAAKTPP